MLHNCSQFTNAFTCNHWYCPYKGLQHSQKLNGMPPGHSGTKNNSWGFLATENPTNPHKFNTWCHTGRCCGGNDLQLSCGTGSSKWELEATSACSLIGNANGGEGLSALQDCRPWKHRHRGHLWVFRKGESSGANETCVLRAQRAALTYFTGMYHSLLACTLWKLDA